MKRTVETSEMDPSAEAAASNRSISKSLGAEHDFWIMMQVSKYQLHIVWTDWDVQLLLSNPQMTK